MQLPGFEVTGLIARTAYADVHRAIRRYDGAAVRVELLRTGDAAVAARLTAASGALRRADGRHLVRVRQVLDAPLGVVRDDVPAESFDGVDPVRVVADTLDALAGLHALGLVHGALTAQDLLLDASVPLRPVVRVTGWGLAGLLSDVPLDPAGDVLAAGRLLAELLGGLPEPVAGMVAADPAARPTAAEARDLLRHLQGMPAALPVVPVRGPASAPPDTSAPPFAPVPSAAPAPDPPAAAAPAASPTGRTAPPPAAPRRADAPPARDLRRPLALAAAALVVLTVGVLGGRLLAGDDPATRAQRDPAVAVPAGPYVLPAITRADGLVVERTWLLEQGGAVLRGTTVVRNPTLQVVNAQVDEVLPTSIAEEVDDLEYTPAPDAILQRDRVVRFEVRSLPPAGSTTWTFLADLPAPVQREALPRLAAEADAVRAEHERVAAPGAPVPTPTS